jgi:hypothetical protein
MMSQALVISILNRWHPMTESIVAHSSKKYFKLQITEECIGILIAHNSYKQMRMLISSGISVAESLPDLLDASSAQASWSQQITAKNFVVELLT